MKTAHQADGDAFTAIAHPVRRKLLDRLAERERSVNELAADFSISRPAISQHLKVLLDAGLVSVRREGRERIYQIEPDPLQELDAWLASYRHLWSARLDRLDKYLQELQAKESNDDHEEP